MNRNLDTARWPDIAPGHATVAVPVGAFEQHGPHLPLDTDTRIATAVAGALPDVVTAPPVAYGASGEHEAFAGTVSIGAGSWAARTGRRAVVVAADLREPACCSSTGS